MLIPIAAIAGLAALFGLLLGYSAIRFRVEGDPIADQVDGLLPQSQCGQCGFPGCRPYAEAIASGEAAINLCAPGGETVMLALADLLGRDPVTAEGAAPRVKCVAVIDERACIGCTQCVKACPVDAVVGATKQLHGVIASECTGCGLCLQPCPVACVRLVPIPLTVATWKWPCPVPAVAGATAPAVGAPVLIEPPPPVAWPSAAAAPRARAAVERREAA